MNKEKIKILFITVRADFGGGPEHLFKLSKSLSDDFEVFIASPKDYPYYEKYLRITGHNRITKIPHRKFSPFSLIKLIRIVIKNKINIIHSHGKGAGLYSRLLSLLTGKKTIHTFHGLHIGQYGKVLKPLYLILERMLGAFTNRFITVSPSEKEMILSNRICSNDKIMLIENGVETSDKTINHHLAENQKFNIITVTRFDYAKNSELLYDIALSLKSKLENREFTITVLGDGKGKSILKNKISNSPVSDNIIFYGAVTNPQYYLLKSHCYLSTSRWEGLPLAILEAMAVGLPVVATNVVGNKDIVKDSINGLLYELGSPEKAADCILKIMNNNYLFAGFSKNAVNQIVTDYNLDNMVKKTENLYYSISKK